MLNVGSSEKESEDEVECRMLVQDLDPAELFPLSDCKLKKTKTKQTACAFPLFLSFFLSFFFCDFKPQEIQRSKGEEKKARQQSAVSATDTHK